MLTEAQKKEILGVVTKTDYYKLNEVSMSGDDGHFNVRKVAEDKGEDGKYKKEDWGKTLQGVVLKMRWRYGKYDESAGMGTYYSSSEFDKKDTDEVTIYPTKEKGVAYAMKEKYQLQTQRVVYFYVPKYEQIVRLVVKASALTGDKNPSGEMGLFDIEAALRESGKLLCDVVVECSGVYREDKQNKRKSYYAMSFGIARDLKDSEGEKVATMMLDVQKKTGTMPEAVPHDEATSFEASSEEDVASSIPF